MSDIENPTSGRAPQAKRTRGPRRAAHRGHAGGDSTERKRASAKEDDLGNTDVVPPISEIEAEKLGAIKEYWAFTGAQGFLIRLYNEATPEEKAKLVDDYITKKDAFLFKAIDTYAAKHKALATSKEVAEKMSELSKKFFIDEQANARRALKMKGGAEEFLQTRNMFIRDAMPGAVYAEKGAAVEPAPPAEVQPPKKPEKAGEKPPVDKEAILRNSPAIHIYEAFGDKLDSECRNFNAKREAYLKIASQENSDPAQRRTAFTEYNQARRDLVGAAAVLIRDQEGIKPRQASAQIKALMDDFAKGEADALLAVGGTHVEADSVIFDRPLPPQSSSETLDTAAVPLVSGTESPDALAPAEPEAEPKKKKKEKAPPASSTEIEGGPFDIHKGVGQPISPLDGRNFAGASPNAFPGGDFKLETLDPDMLNRLRTNGEYAEIEGLPKPPEEVPVENPDGLLPPETFGVEGALPPVSERIPLRDQTERARETLTVDALLVALGRTGRENAFGSSMSKFKRAEQAYKGHLLQKQRSGKEVRLGADAVKLREQYIEARNDLLFTVAQMMRPGAGFVPANEAERNRSPEKQWIDFTMADVAHAFLANEQQELGNADTSFDAVYSILREPVLMRSLGPSILKNEAFAGQYGTSMLDKLLNPNTEQFAPGLTDQSVINEFDDARLEFYAALIRKMQKSSANRNALGGKDARFKDFRRSWLDRNDPIFQFNRGRQGFEDRYEKAFKALDKAMKQNIYIDEATRNEARRQFKQLITNEESIENNIERDRLSRQKRGRVRPLADAIRTNGWNAERFIASAAQRVGRRFPPESAGESSDEGGEEAAPAPERAAPSPEAAPAPAYQVKEGETMTVAFENWLPTMPEGVRNRLLSGLRIDRELPNNSIAIELLKELGDARDMVTKGAMFIFSQRGTRQGLYLISADGQSSKRLTDELGKNLIASRPERP